MPVDPPTDEQLQHPIEQAAYRLIAVLERQGVLEEGQTDPLAEDSPLLAGLTAASVQGCTATGERAGRRLRRLLSEFRRTFAFFSANSEGHSLSHHRSGRSAPHRPLVRRRPRLLAARRHHRGGP